MSKDITWRTSRPPAPCPRLQPLQSRRALLRGPQGALGLGLQGPGRPSGPLLAPTPSHQASQSKASPTPRRLTTLKRKLDHTMIIVESFCQCCEPLTGNCMMSALKVKEILSLSPFSSSLNATSEADLCKNCSLSLFQGQHSVLCHPLQVSDSKNQVNFFKGFIHYMFVSILMCVHVCKIQLLPMYVSSTPRDDSSL